MEAVQFDPEKHRADIDAWCDGWAQRGQFRRFPDGWLPQLGAIVPGLAAAFLYRTDSGVAFLENVIGNPEATEEERHHAAQHACAVLCDVAKQLGFRFVVGASHNPRVLEGARQLGFNVASHPVTQIVRVLEGHGNE